MILAILPDAMKAETLLNNLSEADFDLNDVSVIMQDANMRNKIAQDVGPLKGIEVAQLSTALHDAGASQEQVQRCLDAVGKGKALVAMKVNPKYEPAASEMFQDQSAELLKVG